MAYREVSTQIRPRHLVEDSLLGAGRRGQGGTVGEGTREAGSTLTPVARAHHRLRGGGAFRFRCKSISLGYSSGSFLV